MMTALGSAVSPQARRQARIKRLSRRRHNTGPAGEQGVQRAERNVAQLADRPPLHAAEQTHQIAMIALRSAAPVNGDLGPERVDRVPSAAMAANSASTASTKASTSANASHEAGEVLAGLKAVPICGWSDGCW